MCQDRDQLSRGILTSPSLHRPLLPRDLHHQYCRRSRYPHDYRPKQPHRRRGRRIRHHQHPDGKGRAGDQPSLGAADPQAVGLARLRKWPRQSSYSHRPCCHIFTAFAGELSTSSASRHAARGRARRSTPGRRGWLIRLRGAGRRSCRTSLAACPTTSLPNPVQSVTLN
jgi:hypothetical protein